MPNEASNPKTIAKKPHGAPSRYTPELGREIAALYAIGSTWADVAAAVNLPPDTLRDWVDGKTKAANLDGFPLLLARARRWAAETHAMAPGKLIAAVDTSAKTAKLDLSKAESLGNWHKWLAERMDRAAWGAQAPVTAAELVTAVTLFSSMSLARSERHVKPTPLQATAEAQPFVIRGSKDGPVESEPTRLPPSCGASGDE